MEEDGADDDRVELGMEGNAVAPALSQGLGGLGMIREGWMGGSLHH